MVNMIADCTYLNASAGSCGMPLPDALRGGGVTVMTAEREFGPGCFGSRSLNAMSQLQVDCRMTQMWEVVLPRHENNSFHLMGESSPTRCQSYTRISRHLSFGASVCDAWDVLTRPRRVDGDCAKRAARSCATIIDHCPPLDIYSIPNPTARRPLARSVHSTSFRTCTQPDMCPGDVTLRALDEALSSPCCLCERH